MKIINDLYKKLLFEISRLFYSSKIMRTLITTPTRPLTPNVTFDQTLLMQALCAILTEKILQELKQETTILYDAEIKKQKLISESSEKYSVKHSKILKNTGILLNNLNLINKELASLRLSDAEIKAHIKMILRLENIDWTLTPTPTTPTIPADTSV